MKKQGKRFGTLLLILVTFLCQMPAMAFAGEPLSDGESTDGTGDGMIPTRIYIHCEEAGDAIIIQDGEGASSRFGMVDVGWDRCQQQVIQGLTDLGVTPETFDFLVLTHAHSDHMGNAPAVINSFQPRVVHLMPYKDEWITGGAGRLWDNQFQYDSAYQAIQDSGCALASSWDPNADVIPHSPSPDAGMPPDTLAARADGPINPDDCGPNDQFLSHPENEVACDHWNLGSTGIRLLNYSDAHQVAGMWDANHQSLGVLVESPNGVRMWLAGDINNLANEAPNDYTLPDYSGRYDEIKLIPLIGKVDAMKLGHHGGEGSNVPEYIKALSPTVAIQTASMSILTEYAASALASIGTDIYSTGDYPGSEAGGAGWFVVTLGDGVSVGHVDSLADFGENAGGDPGRQTPTIHGDSTQVDWTLSAGGTTMTIAPKENCVIEDVTVNGVSKGAVTYLIGLKTGDLVVITSRSSSADGGGNGSGGSTGPGASQETVTNPDGSVTTTTTWPDGTMTETTRYPDGAVTEKVTDKFGVVTETTTRPDGTVTEKVTQKDGTSVERTTTPSGVEGQTELDAGGKVVSAQVWIPAESAGSGVVTAPVKVPKSRDAAGAPKVDVRVGEGVTAQVEIPVSEFGPGTVAVVVHEDGTEEVVRDCVIGENGVILNVEGDVTLKIVDHTKTFADVEPAHHWASGAVEFVAARELFNGMTPNEFAPDRAMDRGMLVTVLYRLAYEPETATGDFDDVDAGAYYAEAVAWAENTGVVNGYSKDEFAPGDDVTREQLALILYRYAKLNGYDVTRQADLSGYADAGSVDGWASDAMKWAVGSGLIQGRTSSTLAPVGSSTRAEVATILMRFCENIVR